MYFAYIYAYFIHINYINRGNILFTCNKKSPEGLYSTYGLFEGIHSLGSPLWGEHGGVSSLGSGYDSALPRFLIGLRALMRSAYAVCLLTVPSHLFQVGYPNT